MCHHCSFLCTDIDVSFTSSTYSVRENEGYVHVCIEITSGLLQRAANVYLSSLDGTAFKLSKQLSIPIGVFSCNHNVNEFHIQLHRQLVTLSFCNPMNPMNPMNLRNLMFSSRSSVDQWLYLSFLTFQASAM